MVLLEFCMGFPTYLPYNTYSLHMSMPDIGCALIQRLNPPAVHWFGEFSVVNIKLFLSYVNDICHNLYPLQESGIDVISAK